MKSSFNTSDYSMLTEEQRAVVNHNYGPALVFAVAGAGKTTSMVHRICRLVNDGIVPANRILATSFNRANVEELKRDLQAMGVRGRVNCRTLHSLGYSLISSAIKKGYLEPAWMKNSNVDQYSSSLVMRTIIALSREEEVDSSQLGIDREELENQISIWKNNLVYADLKKAHLPAEARTIASQAEHENGLYVRAYKIYEEERTREKWMTFDDMLMMGWELLVQYPDLCDEVQGSFDMVLVDEFQDLNLSQSEMLDIIVAKHRNYMAIGDDDQCIYEWRGASPRFILNFEEKYKADVYTISDNFRCTAQQTTLANAVIAQNKKRYKKQLNLTRGFDGETQIIEAASEAEMAKDIYSLITKLLQQGEDISEIVVLIRLYSQTAFLEGELIEHDIAYDVVGSVPFYERSELKVLFQYLAWAQQEMDIRENGFPVAAAARSRYVDRIKSFMNKPRRYISNVMIEEMCNQSLAMNMSFLDVVSGRLEQFKRGTRSKMKNFLSFADQLIERIIDGVAADEVLKWLITTLDYESFLLDMSGVKEVGMTKVQSVEMLKEFAKGRGSCVELLGYIVHLAKSRGRDTGAKPLQIMTMYRAKGLEWKHVIIPGVCNGIMPFGFSAKEVNKNARRDELEAERRLFYVGVTRSKEKLYLFYPKKKGISAFLKHSKAHGLIEKCNEVKQWIYDDSLLSHENVLTLSQLVVKLGLERFFVQWWKERPANLEESLLNFAESAFPDTLRTPQETLAYEPLARAFGKPAARDGFMIMCKSFGLDPKLAVMISKTATAVCKQTNIFSEYLEISDLAKIINQKAHVVEKTLKKLEWITDDDELTEYGEESGGIVYQESVVWNPDCIQNRHFIDILDTFKPVSLSEYSTINAIADIVSSDPDLLLNHLEKMGWIIRHGIRFVITPEGEAVGARYRKKKGKREVVFPPTIIEHDALIGFGN